MYTITKGELWTLREALEKEDTETVSDALSIVNSILDKNVTIEITEEQMYKDPTEELTDDEQASLLTDEELETILQEEEEEHRVC